MHLWISRIFSFSELTFILTHLFRQPGKFYLFIHVVMERENRRAMCHDQVSGRAWVRAPTLLLSSPVFIMTAEYVFHFIRFVHCFRSSDYSREHTHTHTHTQRELMYMMDTYGIHSFFSESYPSKCPGVIII